MAIFDGLRAEIECATEGSVPYISCSFRDQGTTHLNFRKISDITFHDEHALIEHRSEAAVRFYRASDLNYICVHFVSGSFPDYLRNELPDFWNGLSEEVQMAMIKDHAS